MTAKKSPVLGAELVAEDCGAIVGVLDLSAEGQLATIDTIAVHPDHQWRGIGMRARFTRVHVCRRFSRPVSG